MKEETRDSRAPCRYAKILSIDREALLLLSESFWSARVHGCFDRALNLIDVNNNLVTFLSGSRQNGPFRVLLDTPEGVSFREWNLGKDALFFSDGSALICYPQLSIHIGEPDVWSEAWPIPRGSLAMTEVREKLRKALSILIDNSPETEHSLIQAWAGPCDGAARNKEISPMFERLCERSIKMLRVIRRRRPDELKEALRGLVGIGQGLTPSGDDLLAGFASGAHFLDRCILDGNKLPGEVGRCFSLMLEAGETQTTWLSSKFLQRASAGRLSEEVLTFCEIVAGMRSGDIADCAAHLLDYGESSGREIMLGIVGSFSHLLIGAGNW